MGYPVRRRVYVNRPQKSPGCAIYGPEGEPLAARINNVYGVYKCLKAQLRALIFSFHRYFIAYNNDLIRTTGLNGPTARVIQKRKRIYGRPDV